MANNKSSMAHDEAWFIAKSKQFHQMNPKDLWDEGVIALVKEIFRNIEPEKKYRRRPRKEL